MERVNQSDLTAKVAQKLGMPMTTTKYIVDHFVDEIQSALVRGKKVNLSGFVSLGVRKRRARVGRNPKSGASVKVPAGKKLFMKTSSKFKDDLNKPESARKKAAPKKAAKKKVAKKRATPKKFVAKKVAKKRAPAKKVVKKVAKKRAPAKKRVAKKVAKKAAPKKRMTKKRAPAKKRARK